MGNIGDFHFWYLLEVTFTGNVLRQNWQTIFVSIIIDRHFFKLFKYSFNYYYLNERLFKRKILIVRTQTTRKQSTQNKTGIDKYEFAWHKMFLKIDIEQGFASELSEPLSAMITKMNSCHPFTTLNTLSVFRYDNREHFTFYFDIKFIEGTSSEMWQRRK